MVLKGLGMSMDEQESSRVAWVGWLGGDLIGGQGVGQKGGKGCREGSRLTAGVGWGMIH